MSTDTPPATPGGTPPVLTDGPVIDLLGGNLNTVIPPSSAPAAYGDHVRRGGVNVIHVTLALYARDIEHQLDEFFDAFNLCDQMGDKLMLVERTADIHEAHVSGKLGLILGFQGLDVLRHKHAVHPHFSSAGPAGRRAHVQRSQSGGRRLSRAARRRPDPAGHPHGA